MLSFRLRLLVNFLFDEQGIQSEQSAAHASPVSQVSSPN